MPGLVDEGASSSEWLVNSQADQKQGVRTLYVLRDDWDIPQRDGKKYTPCRTPMYALEFDSIGHLELLYTERLCLKNGDRILAWDKNNPPEDTDGPPSSTSSSTSSTTFSDPSATSSISGQGAKIHAMRLAETWCSGDDIEESCGVYVSTSVSSSTSSMCLPEPEQPYERITLYFDSIGHLDQVYICGQLAWDRNEPGLSSSDSSSDQGVVVRLTSWFRYGRDESSIDDPTTPSIESTSVEFCNECESDDIAYADVLCGEHVMLCDLELEFDSVGHLVRSTKLRMSDPKVWCGPLMPCCPESSWPDMIYLTLTAINTPYFRTIEICLERLCDNPAEYYASASIEHPVEPCNTPECEAVTHEFRFRCRGGSEPSSTSADCHWEFIWNGCVNTDFYLDQCCPIMFAHLDVECGEFNLTINGTGTACLVSNQHNIVISEIPCNADCTNVIVCESVSSTSTGSLSVSGPPDP